MERITRDFLRRGEGEARYDARHGVRIFDLGAPMRPGEHATLDFAVRYENQGFTNGLGNTHIVENGTFFDIEYFPSIGYRDSQELTEDRNRREYGLPPRRWREPTDPEGLARDYATPDADWIDFAATVCTSRDQLPIAPGRVTSDTVAGGRRCMGYASDSKVFGFFAMLSARYAVRRDLWNDVDIEIDYHPEHTYDLDRMVHGIKASLDYYTVNFSPYQHHQVRIVEFPRYGVFAQAFPNTIPYSEAIGFIMAVDDTKEDAIDLPFYVTAHEVAHQWWGHQVMSANTQGATFVTESMAQYSALMVMKKELGRDAMGRFMRYELDRYLRGRTQQTHREMPLDRVEDDGYIHYAKGSLAMYALADYIGEDTVNRALRKFVGEHAFKGAPYPTGMDLVASLREVTPEKYAYLIHDLFETITLYENRAERATYQARPDGKYDVHVVTHAKKLRADESGAETEIPLSDYIDVGVMDEKGHVLALEKERFEREEQSFDFVVDREPARAGIDPLNELVDRIPDDNRVKVTRE